MTNKSAMINDLTKILTNVASVAFESGKNVRENVFQHLKGSSENLGFATKDELEVLRLLVESQNAEIQNLHSQIESLTNNLQKLDEETKKSEKKVTQNSSQSNLQNTPAENQLI